MVWAIASEEDNEDAARDFADALDLTMPVLYDAGGVVHADYVLERSVQCTAYPEGWITGRTASSSTVPASTTPAPSSPPSRTSSRGVEPVAPHLKTPCPRAIQ